MKRYILAALLLLPFCARPETGASIIANSGFEDGADAPEGWPTANPAKGISYETEDGNRFARIHSDGGTAMIYREIVIPEGVEALRLSWRWRVSGLRKGPKPWFDARIMMEFMDGARQKVAGAPGAPNRGKDTDGWERGEKTFLVPPGARTLKFMPSLLDVAAGTLDIDDIALEPADPAGPRAEQAEREAGKAAKAAAEVAKRRAKCADRLAKTGSLLPGDGSIVLEQTVPGKMNNKYLVAYIPEGTEALSLSWREKITGLVKGDKPWFDARIISEFLGPDGKKMSGVRHPQPAYSQKDRPEWFERRIEFLVPEGAVALAVMPCLFQTKAGRYEIEGLALAPADPEGPRRAAETRARQEAARYVAPEEPDPAKFPRPLHVEGPKILDDRGNEIWLQGVSLSGTESVAQDRQAEKSTIVAIEHWGANCIRLPVKDDFWFGKTGYQEDGGEEYRALIDRVITLAANRGAYVVLDLHRFRAPKPEHAEFWKDAAARYKNHPAVLFELFNEPHGIGWDVLVNGG
ncbi:MAG: cellulase family glycosylhydrolase, partial [Kiritimatiellae bacterium]|nr:cellulase family glycosylhydrolase [Kiritimatiellia bacterium]